jgi:hypothetical protein
VEEVRERPPHGVAEVEHRPVPDLLAEAVGHHHAAGRLQVLDGPPAGVDLVGNPLEGGGDQGAAVDAVGQDRGQALAEEQELLHAGVLRLLEQEDQLGRLPAGRLRPAAGLADQLGRVLPGAAGAAADRPGGGQDDDPADERQGQTGGAGHVPDLSGGPVHNSGTP